MDKRRAASGPGARPPPGPGETAGAAVRGREVPGRAGLV